MAMGRGGDWVPKRDAPPGSYSAAIQNNLSFVLMNSAPLAATGVL